MPVQTKEARIILAIEAIRTSKNLSRRAAAKIYNVPETTLRDRMNGHTSIANRRPAVQKLTELEENVIVQYVLDLDSRGFPPRIEDVREMADQILATRTKRRVGKLWPYRFVQRRKELRTRFSRAYDFQRALVEDPDELHKWFRLFRNMREKYGVADSDIYNFDETGFMMGIICGHMVVTRADRRGKSKSIQPGNREWATAIACISGDGFDVPPFLVVQGQYHLASWYSEGGLPYDWSITTSSNGWTNNETGLEWLRHFDKHTKERRKGGYRMLILDGHESHQSALFEEYCKLHNIIPLCLPSHSSHLTQPLDVGLFSWLKRAYGREISTFIRAHITHITKVEFFLAFHAAYKACFNKENMAGGFRGAGLIPFNPEAVISKLDVKLRTPTPPESPSAAAAPWVTQTPHNPTEAISQATLVNNSIDNHQGSSPTPILASTKQMVKGTMKMAHEMTLMSAELRNLRAANDALSKRRRAKKTRLRQGGTLTQAEGSQILADKEAVAEEEHGIGRNGGGENEGRATARKCSKCGKTDHNARTCQVDE